MKNPKDYKTECAKCAGKFCFPLAEINTPLPPIEKAPLNCPIRRYREIMEKSAKEYERPEIREFARLASVQEAECYEWTEEGIRTKLPRIEELIRFSEKCNYKKLGLAFCIGLKEEAKLTTDILQSKGFDVYSVCCKTGRIPKEEIGLKGDEKILGPDLMETACNPVAQAEILNKEAVDLAVMLGLCIGHDTLFIKYCKMPSTVLAVKDRVLAHNPLAALYLSKGPYYSRITNQNNRIGTGKKVTLPENVREPDRSIPIKDGGN